MHAPRAHPVHSRHHSGTPPTPGRSWPGCGRRWSVWLFQFEKLLCKRTAHNIQKQLLCHISHLFECTNLLPRNYTPILFSRSPRLPLLVGGHIHSKICIPAHNCCDAYILYTLSVLFLNFHHYFCTTNSLEHILRTASTPPCRCRRNGRCMPDQLARTSRLHCIFPHPEM